MKIMHTVKKVNIIFFLTVMTISVSAQIEDEIEILEQTEPENCQPESMTIAYDQFDHIESSLDDIRQWYSFGSEYFKNKNLQAGLPYLWKVFLNDTTKYARLAIGKIAESYFNLQMADSTILACYRGLVKFPDLISLHYYAGYLQDQLGKFRCAIPHYEALVKENPKEKEYLKKLAFLYYKNENTKAIEIQTRVVDLDQNDSEAQNTLALYMEHFLGQGGGLEAFKNAWENDKTNLEFAFKYGKAAYDAGQYKLALEPLTIIINANPDFKALKYRAMCYESLERYNEAINDYKAMLKIEPQNSSVMCAIANDYRSLNEFVNAKYWVGKALQAKSGYGLAYITMAEIYESAVNHCQNMEKRDRKYDDGFVYELALQEYKKALNDPEFSSMAKIRIKNLGPFLLTDEERFMHRGDNLKIKCYDWLK